MEDLTRDQLIERLWQAQQLIAAIVEIHGTTTPVGRVLDIPYADLDKIQAHPQVMTDNLTDREVVRLRRA